MEQKKIRWGLLGAGAILDRFMNGAKQWDDMEVVAIASRTPESAKKMAEKYDVPEVLTYDGLLAREDIDVVYIPVPHTAHKELAIKAMKAKKAVLVEKPAGINVRGEGEGLRDVASKSFTPRWEIDLALPGKGGITMLTIGVFLIRLIAPCRQRMLRSMR